MVIFNKKLICLIIVFSIFVILFVLTTYLPAIFMEKIFLKDNLVFLSVCFYFLGILLSRFIGTIISNFCGELIKRKIDKNIKTYLIQKYINQTSVSLHYIETKQVEYLFSNHSKIMADSISDIIEATIYAITSLIYVYIYMFLTNVYICCFVILVTLIWILLNIYIRSKNRINFLNIKKREQELGIKFIYNFKNTNFLKNLNKIDFLEGNFKNEIELYTKNRKKYSNVRIINFGISTFMYAISQLGIITMAMVLMKMGEIEEARFMSLVYISGMLITPIKKIDGLFDYFDSYKTTSKLLKEVEVKWKECKYVFHEEKIKKVKLENVFFGYDKNNDKYLFENINYEFKLGVTYKIDGASGTGKSTMINIILNNIKPISGNVIINDNIRTNEYYNIASISQNNSIFSTTIIKNITLNGFEESNVVSKELENILKTVGLSKLKGRLFTDININKNNLSGGEIRRLEFARIFMSNSNFWILDEPFSGIDHENKEKIINYILKNKQDKIIIFTSHENDALEDLVVDKKIILNNQKI